MCNNARLVLAPILLLPALPSWSQADGYGFSPYGASLFRYESDFDNPSKDNRRRIRLDAQLGTKLNFPNHWFVDTRLSTGLKDKQNVPAITLKQFTDQAIPERDVYLDRYYLAYQHQGHRFHIGKIPWSLKRSTDMFWDHNLNPFGASAHWSLSGKRSIDLGIIKPLDGSSDSVGSLNYISFNQAWQLTGGVLSISPWFVDYRGERDAEFATADTQYDNRSIRLDSYYKWNNWKLSLDIGHSLSSFNEEPTYSNEKTAWAAEIKHGDIKSVGHTETYVRWLHVERFGVIQEFAQNATAGHMTANFEGVDVRIRHKVSTNWWIGSRFSQLQSLKGAQKEGARFRIEAKYQF